ncbi:hypothetical protein LPJ56_002722, partial [Coemansia sp. RSA 2599]
MDYESYYMSLWNRLSLAEGASQIDCAQLERDMCRFKSVIEKALSTSDISRDQWIGSLAVAASLAVPGFAWSNPHTAAAADKWIAAIISRIGESNEQAAAEGGYSISGGVFRAIVSGFVQPYFKAENKESSSTYVLMNSREKKTHVFGKQKWKTEVQSVACFSWALEHLCPEDTVDAISCILPVVLALIDDYDTKMKTRGLQLAILLMARKADKEFLRKSGIAGILEKSIEPSLV